MKIISLQAENIKKLVAVEIRPDGNLVPITGGNGNGKTSVLDAIWWAFTGARNIQAQPIRRGAESARIVVDIGQFLITRTFNLQEDGSYTTGIKVVEDGAKVNKPQDVLNAIIGDLAFDPLEFMRRRPEDQFDLARAFVPDIDFVALARADKADYEARTTENRKAKEMRAQAEGITLPAGKLPRRVDLAALETKLGEASTHNVDIERRKQVREQAKVNAYSIRARAEELRAEAQKLLTQAQEHEAEAVAIDQRLADAEALPDPIDVAQVTADLAAGRTSNATLDQAARKAQLNTEAQAHEDESKRLTKAIDDREAGKQAAIAAAKMPVPGLSFGDGVVLLDGLPFDQASDAQQLQAAVAIAAEMNPRLRVIRIRDGSLLDADAMTWLKHFADDKDMQIWVERVGSNGGMGFEIEAGRLKSDDEAEAEPDEVFG